MDDGLRASLRIGPLLLAAVIMQVAVVTQFSLLGVTPDIIPLLVASIGLLAGSTTGALTGFTAGLIIDLALVQTLGVSSLLLTVIGYYAGRLREQYDPVNPLVPAAIGAAAAGSFVFGFAVLQFSLGAKPPSAVGLLVQFFVATALGLLLGTFVFRIARRTLLDTLGMNDPVARRRRATTVRYRFQPTRQRRQTVRLRKR